MGMKKSIPKVWERESEASILGNDREREFPLTPVQNVLLTVLRMDKAAAERPFRCFNHCFQKVTDFQMWDQILPDETLQKVSTLNFI